VDSWRLYSENQQVYVDVDDHHLIDMLMTTISSIEAKVETITE
jgi:hypothetical protein